MNREQFYKLRRVYRITSQYQRDEGPSAIPEHVQPFRNYGNPYDFGLYDLKFLWSRALHAKAHPEWWPDKVVDIQAIHDTIRRCIRSNAMCSTKLGAHQGYPCYWQRDEELRRHA